MKKKYAAAVLLAGALAFLPVLGDTATLAGGVSFRRLVRQKKYII